MIIIPGEFASQPQYNALIDPEWLARGLVIVCNPAVGAYNAVTKQFVTNSGGLTTTPTDSGKSWQGAASKYVDFGDTFAPASRGATAIQVINPGASANVFSFSSRAGSGSSGFEILIGNGGVAGAARARLDTVAITSDVTGLNDGRDHVLAARYTPSTELKIWADNLGKSASITSSIPASITPDQNLRLHSRGATYYTGKSGLFLYFDRPLSDSSVGALLQNPWQVFSPPKREILVSVSGGGGSTGTLAKTNANDSISASGSTTVIGSLSTANASDTLAASGSAGAVSGTASITEAVDTLAVSGTTTVTGSAVRTLANDTLAAQGTTSVTGSLATANADDFIAASGGVGDVVTGALAYNNVSDTLAASGYPTLTGGANVAETADSATISGTSTVVGTLAKTNVNDSVSANGVAGAITGSVAVTDNGDGCVARGSGGNVVVEAFSGGYIISREEHAERRKRQRIKLGIIEDDSPATEQFEISELTEEKPVFRPPLKDKLIPARLQKQQRLEQEKAELAYLVQLEAERLEEEEVQTILRMLMEL